MFRSDRSVNRELSIDQQELLSEREFTLREDRGNILLNGDVDITEALGYGDRYDLVVIMRMGAMIK